MHHNCRSFADFVAIQNESVCGQVLLQQLGHQDDTVRIVTWHDTMIPPVLDWTLLNACQETRKLVKSVS